ncbi:MAG: DUF1684 domain-containing protein [Candidatus Eisenbacteria bacterium]
MRLPFTAPGFALLLIASASIAAPAPPVRLSAVVTDSLTRAVNTDRAETEKWLKGAATSYLATVKREDFGERSQLSLGRDAHEDVRIDDPEWTAHHLQVSVRGDSFEVKAIDPAASFTVKGERVRSAVVGPSAIGVGRFTVRLSHQRYPAIIVFDPHSPRFAEYKGMKWFPVDFRYRFIAPLVASPRADTTTIMSTRGNARRAVRVGWFQLKMGGRSVKLEAQRLLEPGVGENDMSLFFQDATTGHESYGVGRYLEPVKLADGRYLLDFNNCYSPACAYSPHYNCPIPPKANRLAVAVRAGEMDAHYQH